MELHCGSKSANTNGGDRTYSLAGDFLQGGLGDYGQAVREIWMIPCFRGGRVLIEERYEEFHSNFLPSLPKVKFFRKKANLEIEYEAAVFDANYHEQSRPFVDLLIFERAVIEISEKLHLMDARLKKTDAFDLVRFHSDIGARIKELPRSDNELRAFESKIKLERKERLKQMGPWERLHIDWDDYHPKARELLNSPFFWDPRYDSSPHGNDTGADLLADFKKWNKRHPDVPAHQMARSLMKRWGIPMMDFNIVDEAAVQKLLDQNVNALLGTDEAMIAVAFAAIKLRGSCDDETRRSALLAIERERQSSVLNGTGWVNPSDRLQELKMMEAVLRNLPSNA